MADDWNPVLEEGDGPLYERIVVALERDVREGVLGQGARLPPQRNLAFQLGLSVGTVTKAYVEAERRGLVQGHVGRGTFVAGPWGAAEQAQIDPQQVIDFSLNVIPHQAAARRVGETLATLKRRCELFDAMGYAPPAGPDAHRRAAAAWLSEIASLEADWSRLVLTAGAQQAMSLALMSLCQPGDTVLCEAATYYGMKSLAEQSAYRLRGVAMDEEGALPDSLDKAAAETGSRIFYTMPNVQNPTARTMSPERRRAIAKIVRKRELWVLEDDVYPLFTPERKNIAPLAAQIPERTFYISCASKSLAPGLRLGFLVCPNEERTDAVLRGVRAMVFAPSALGSLTFSQWVEDGSAREIGQAVKAEIVRRASIAAEAIGPEFGGHVRNSPHFWLPMPELEAERVAGRALREGVAVTPPAAPIVDGRMISGLRICLGAAGSDAELLLGLERLRAALSPARERALSAVV